MCICLHLEKKIIKKRDMHIPIPSRMGAGSKANAVRGRALRITQQKLKVL